MSEKGGNAESQGSDAAGGGEGAQLTDGAQMSWLLSTTVERVQAVLSATDEAAARIREDAQAEADRYLEDARRRAESLTRERMDRIATLTEDLMGQASAVQQQSQALRVAMERATDELNRDLGPADAQASSARAAEVTAESEQPGATGAGPEQSPAAETPKDSEGHGLRERIGRRRRKGDDSEEGINEGARVLALQQLMAGADRATVEKALTEDFGIDDPSVILDSLEPYVRG